MWSCLEKELLAIPHLLGTVRCHHVEAPVLHTQCAPERWYRQNEHLCSMPSVVCSQGCHRSSPCGWFQFKVWDWGVSACSQVGVQTQLVGIPPKVAIGVSCPCELLPSRVEVLTVSQRLCLCSRLFLGIAHEHVAPRWHCNVTGILAGASAAARPLPPSHVLR